MNASTILKVACTSIPISCIHVLFKSFIQFHLKQTRTTYIRLYGCIATVKPQADGSSETFLVMRRMYVAAASSMSVRYILLNFCVLMHTRHSPTLRLVSPSFPQATSSITVLVLCALFVYQG